MQGLLRVIPTVVAESLEPVVDPLSTALRPGPLADAAAVARALADTLAPPRADLEPPSWLRASQTCSFRRLLTAISRYHGALLADPVGSGKTFVALAVAQVWNNRRPTVCLVPAAIASQWREVAQGLSVPVIIHSHTRLSRGSTPEIASGLVIIDESHHFRNPATKRYQTLAPWLGRCPALLLSATPLVNRLDDLHHQLRLTIRDDALAPLGLGSLRRELSTGARLEKLSALGHLIVAGSGGPGRPGTISRELSGRDGLDSGYGGILEDVDALQLSTHPPVAALIRGAFWRAAASSPAAFLGSLRRYRRLLLDARDARAAGRIIDRAFLRRVTAGAEDQLMLWSLLPTGETETDLVLEDLAPLDALLARVINLTYAGDPKLDRLRAVLRDGKRALVFVTARETVRFLRDRLPEHGVAWCVGDRAGIGRCILPRETVLQLFGPQSAGGSPAILISTDVAAEGLNLQRAERVIHYDLPWTTVRLEQRDGRALRLGSTHSEVEVVHFHPPPELQRRLCLLPKLEHKSRLPAVAGLGQAGRRLWRWRQEVAERFAPTPGVRGVAAVEAESPGILAGFSLREAAAESPEPFRIDLVLWLGDGCRSEEMEVIEAKLATATESIEVLPVGREELEEAIAVLIVAVRDRLRCAARDRWVPATLTPEAHRLIRRLRNIAARAARNRDADMLERLDRAIRFAGGGHTAGEASLVGALAAAPEVNLRRQIAELPSPSRTWGPLAPKLTGLILFRSRSGGLRSPND